MEKKPKEKLEKYFKEVLDEHKDKLSYIDNSGQDIENELNNIKEKYLDHIRKACFQQFRWLDENASVLANQNGIHIHVNHNMSPDADVILTELKSCASQNDKGLKEFFDQKNMNKQMILKQNERCMAQCAFGASDKIDKEIKNCISECFVDSYKDTRYLLEEIKFKIHSVKKDFDV